MNILYTIIGLAYAFAHKTAVSKFLSATLSGWIKFGAWAMAIWAWWRLPRPALALAITFLLLIYLFYWWAKRTGYSKFVTTKTLASIADQDISPFPANSKIMLHATGIFSTSHWETKLLLRPASYWQVPLGEHVVMVEHEQGKFAYQFFSAVGLQNVEQGMLLNGRLPHPAIAITYLSTWSPNSDKLFQAPLAPLPENAKKRTIYLTFETVEDEKLVWHNIVRDARQAREEAVDKKVP